METKPIRGRPSPAPPHSPSPIRLRREFLEPDWRRIPAYKDVSAADWESALWQRKHTVKNLQGAEGRARRAAARRPGRRASSATRRSGRRCRMLLPPQMLNTMNLEDLWQRPGAPLHAAGVRGPPHRLAQPPQGQPRQPPRGRDVGGRGPHPPLPDQGAGGDAAHLPAVLRPLHPHGPGRQRRAPGRTSTSSPSGPRSATSRCSTTCAARPPCATWWSPAATSPTCPSSSSSRSSAR